MGAQELLIDEHGLGGKATGRRQVKRADAFVVERHDAFARAEPHDDLGEIARQRSFPAQGIHATDEGRRE